MDLLDILSNIGFDWRVALANFVNFLLIFFLLKHYAFPAIERAIAERRRKIVEGMENARKAETALLSAETERQQQLAAARREATQIVTAARDQEKKIVADAAGAAEQRAQMILQEASERLAANEQTMRSGIRSHAARLIARGVERVLRESADEPRDRAVIDRAVSELS